MRLAAWSIVVLGSLALPAVADPPAARQRVVLADTDRELWHAMDRALAPWHLEVVVDGAAPANAAEARRRADGDTARFVVWRRAEQLVVYDRELGTIERRTSRAGALDPPTAAAAALTIKTMMRLPPPPSEPAPIAPPVDAAPPPPIAVAPAAPCLRIGAGVVARIARGATSDDTSESTTAVTRVVALVAVHPWPAACWWLGASGDAGSSETVSRAGFKGAWSEWAIYAVAGCALGRGAWEIEPEVGAGLRHSTLDGTEGGAARTESATLAAVRAGVWARWRYAHWTVGVIASVGETFAAPTYTKIGTPAEVFQVPGTAVELGALVTVDL